MHHKFPTGCIPIEVLRNKIRASLLTSFHPKTFSLATTSSLLCWIVIYEKRKIKTMGDIPNLE
jgi:hypothetical protein